MSVVKKSLSSLLALFMVCVTLVWIPVTAHASTELDSVVDDDGNLSIGTLEEYQAEIRARGLENSTASQLAEENNELLVLRTGLVEQVGYDTIMDVAQNYEGGNETLIWLMSDIDALRDYVTGGTPYHTTSTNNTYKESLQVLTDLYTGSKVITCSDSNNTDPCDGNSSKTYYFKDDLANEEASEADSETHNNTTLGDVYRTLMIAISLTHEGEIGYWQSPVEMSTAVDRYWVLRTFRSDPEKYDFAALTFDSLTVPEMRLITGAWISDRQLAWLNWYRVSNSYSKVWSDSYFGYEHDMQWSYQADEYYSEDNRQTWEDEYSLTSWNDDDPLLADYDLNYGYVDGSKEVQPWIVFEEGGVCGAQAKTTQNLLATAGYPAVVVSQPSHAATMYYTVENDSDLVQQPVSASSGNAYQEEHKGYGRWTLWNSVSTWAQTGINADNNGFSITLLGWGSENSERYMASYILLAQEALNLGDKHGETYYLTSEIRIVANAYESVSPDTQIDILEAAFDEQPANWDTVLELVDVYQDRLDNGEITIDEFTDMAVRVIDGLKYYPLPTWHVTTYNTENLLNIVCPSSTTCTNADQWALIYDTAVNALETAKVVTVEEIMQPNASKDVANYYLNGNGRPTYDFPFTFEFSLDDGTATLTPKTVQKSGKSTYTWTWQLVNGQYSTDGGATWYDFQGTTTIPTNVVSQLTDENAFLVKFSDARTWSVDVGTAPNVESKVTVGDEGIDIPVSWSDVSSADSYNVIVYKDGEPVIQEIVSTTESSFTFTEVGVYYVSVSSVSDETVVSAPSISPVYIVEDADGSWVSETFTVDSLLESLSYASASYYEIEINSAADFTGEDISTGSGGLSDYAG